LIVLQLRNGSTWAETSDQAYDLVMTVEDINIPDITSTSRIMSLWHGSVKYLT
jgi:hypothetical protein